MPVSFKTHVDGARTSYKKSLSVAAAFAFGQHGATKDPQISLSFLRQAWRLAGSAPNPTDAQKNVLAITDGLVFTQEAFSGPFNTPEMRRILLTAMLQETPEDSALRDLATQQALTNALAPNLTMGACHTAFRVKTSISTNGH